MFIFKNVFRFLECFKIFFDNERILGMSNVEIFNFQLRTTLKFDHALRHIINSRFVGFSLGRTL